MYKKPTRYIVYFLEFKIQSFSLTGHLGSEHHSIVALGGGSNAEQNSQRGELLTTGEGGRGLGIDLLVAFCVGGGAGSRGGIALSLRMKIFTPTTQKGMASKHNQLGTITLHPKRFFAGARGSSLGARPVSPHNMRVGTCFEHSV